jgi:DNA-binding NarL/FixJ family response regulator
MLEESPRSNTERTKVVILEDGRYDRLGMTTELSTEPAIELVCATAQPWEVLAAIQEHRPQVAVIDLRIYDDDAVGLDVIREVRHTALPVKVIVLTAFPDLSNFLAAFDLGVEAFVKKAASEPRPTLTELVRLVATGGRYYDPDVTRVMRQRLEGMHPQQENDLLIMPIANTAISDRELEVLNLVAAGCTIQQIADALVITPNTVKTHLRNLKAKLGAKDRREAVLIAESKGLLNPLSQQK